MKNKLIYFVVLFFFIFKSYSNTEKKIIVGSERFDQYYELIKNKSVGLLVNHTSMVANNHLIDTLLSQGINVTKIFTPEHGFKGNIERGKSINNDELLVSNKMTIATAESCTGGLIGDRLTNVSGSSKYYKGGVVAYSYEIKSSQLHVNQNILNSHGAVSEEVALEMARGVRSHFSSDGLLNTLIR